MSHFTDALETWALVSKGGSWERYGAVCSVLSSLGGEYCTGGHNPRLTLVTVSAVAKKSHGRDAESGALRNEGGHGITARCRRVAMPTAWKRKRRPRRRLGRNMIDLVG
jgi:hypothetical protein